MKQERRLLELYLEQTDEPGLEEFLEFVYRVLFSAYVKKTALGTRKAYSIKEARRKEQLCYLEDPETGRAADRSNGDEAEETVVRIVLLQALNALPEKQAGVLDELYIKSKNEWEVASERGISRQAVNGLKRRGLTALRGKLK